MGQLEKAEHDARDKARENGKGKGKGSSSGRMSKLAGQQPGGGADWGNCDPRWLQAVTVGITALGGALILGLSRDGGAYNVTLLLDGERKQFWISCTADLEAELEQVYRFIEALS